MKNLGTINDEKSILTKGYGDSTYAPASLTETVGGVLDALAEVQRVLDNLSKLYVDADGNLVYDGKLVVLSDKVDAIDEKLDNWFKTGDSSESANPVPDELDISMTSWFVTGDSEKDKNPSPTDIDEEIDTWFD